MTGICQNLLIEGRLIHFRNSEHNDMHFSSELHTLDLRHQWSRLKEMSVVANLYCRMIISPERPEPHDRKR